MRIHRHFWSEFESFYRESTSRQEEGEEEEEEKKGKEISLLGEAPCRSDLCM